MPAQSIQRQGTSQRKPSRRQKTFWQKLRNIPWNKKYVKLPLWVWIVIVVLLVGLVGIRTEDSPKDIRYRLGTPTVIVKETVEPLTAEKTSEPTTVPTSEPINDPFEYTAYKVFKDNYTIKHIENNDIYLRFKIDGWNKEKTIDCFKLYVYNYAKMLSQEFTQCTYGTLYFVGWVDTVDVYGQTGTADAIRLAIDKIEIDKINWDRFLFGNVDIIGHDYTVGTILR